MYSHVSTIAPCTAADVSTFSLFPFHGKAFLVHTAVLSQMYRLVALVPDSGFFTFLTFALCLALAFSIVCLALAFVSHLPLAFGVTQAGSVNVHKRSERVLPHEESTTSALTCT